VATYAFDNEWRDARERLRGLEHLLDPGSIRHLEALAVGSGWHCLEVGAGGGTIAGWLCRRVGPGGRVVATDLETRFLQVMDEPNLEVRHHNIASDDLPEGQFDLVFARLVLKHIQERERVLGRMFAALRRGGWLMCEDTDNSSVALLSPGDAASNELFMRVERAKDAAMAARGHAYCGRQLWGLFHTLELTDIQAEGRVPLLRAGTGPARWKRLSVEQLRENIIGAGLATAGEIEAYLTLVDSPGFAAQGFTVMTVWGRRPA